MKVILNSTVPKVGKQWQVVTVADGYARNYLFPRGLAIVADKNQIAALEKRMKRLEEKTAGEKAAAEALRDKIEGAVVRIEGQVGRDAGKLFGAITSQDIVDALKAQHKFTVEKKQVALHDPIKRLGKHEVVLDLHRSVDANIIVEVYDPNAPVAVVAEPEAAPVEEAHEEEAVEA
ncbi:MAG: 50S ribosomal protein L9 [Armatimonadetes bacterium]|nr:50S ribosomal protein L9 [Armatimonadota bacterium]